MGLLLDHQGVDRFRLAGRQGGDRPGRLRQHDVDELVGLPHGHGPPRLGLGVAPAHLVVPFPRQEDVAHHGHQPGLQVRARLELVGPPQGPLDAVLHQVLGLHVAARPDQPAGEALEVAEVLADLVANHGMAVRAHRSSISAASAALACGLRRWGSRGMLSIPELPAIPGRRRTTS